jgi:hydrogenase maturation protease
MKTVVIGLGNPILSDDGVGIHVARLVKQTVGTREDLVVTELYAGGLCLMDALAGYGHAVIIDAMVTGEVEPGTIRAVPLTGAAATRNLASTHDANLPAALELGRALGLPLPERIDLWGIEASEVEHFGEVLTEAVARAVPLLAGRVICDLAERP